MCHDNNIQEAETKTQYRYKSTTSIAPMHITTLLLGFVNSPCAQNGLISNHRLLQKSNYCPHHKIIGGGYIRRTTKRQFSINDVNTIPISATNSHRRMHLKNDTYSRKRVCRSVSMGSIAMIDFKSTLYMALLALQFAIQPILTKKFTPKSINRSTVVMSQDFVKVLLTFTALNLTGSWSKAIQDWSIRSWLTVAGIPAFIYSIQNFATLVGYQNLPPLTFNVLNQTKTLSAALCCYIFMGKVQSKIQIMSLLLLFLSACVIEKLIPLRRQRNCDTNNNDDNHALTRNNDVNETEHSEEKRTHIEGVIAVSIASFLSGLAGALTQKNLQCQKSVLVASRSSNAGTSVATQAMAAGGRNSYLFTMEIAIASLCFMTLSTMFSSDGKRIRTNGFFDQWTPGTLIPIITNAMGAVFVGLVIKYAGAVKKGFALIFGLVLSGVLQAYLLSNGDGSAGESKISFEQIVGGILAAISLWMHNSFPAKIGS